MPYPVAAYHIGPIKPMRTKNPPAYSFGSRTSPFAKRGMIPAPNAYNLPSLTGGVSVGKKTNPIYSMTGKSTFGGASEDLCNVCACQCMSVHVCACSCMSLHVHACPSHMQTPGPGAYKAIDLDVYTKKSPVYTLHNRDPAASSMMRNPGPGAHSPEKVSKGQ